MLSHTCTCRTALDVLGAITLHNMSVSPSAGSAAALLAADLSIQVLSPLGPACPLYIRTFGMPYGQLLYRNRRVASLSIDNTVALTNPDGSVAVSLASPLTVDDAAFAAFLSDVLNADILTVALAGELVACTRAGTVHTIW